MNEKCFNDVGLTLNKEKCKLNESKITFFGYQFSSDGISADPKKIEAIHTAPPPQSVKKVRSFLGMATYCAKFIPQFSDLSEPLRQLTKKNSNFHWTTKEQNSFNNIKTALTSETVMASQLRCYFDKSKQAGLFTDEAPTGLSAILSQTTPGKEDRKIVAYVSRSLTDVESCYSQTEKEALAIVWAIERLHIYLYGGKFTLYTDYKPLETILCNPSSRSPARIERWYLRLQEYNFDVVYKKGSENPSDFLSRHTRKDSEDNVEISVAENYVNFLSNHALPNAMTLVEIQKATLADNTLQKLAQIIEDDSWHTIQNLSPDIEIDKEELQLFAKIRSELTVSQNRHIILRGSRIIIPKSLRSRAIAIAVESHFGLVKTKQLLREKIWFPGIDKDIKEKIDNCIPCQAVGAQNTPAPL